MLLAVLLGVVSSSVVAIFVEWRRQPQLVLTPAPAIDHEFLWKGADARHMRGIKVLVTNRSQPLLLHWLKRESARSCRATLRFLYLDGTEFISSSMPGRWVTTPEPVSPQVQLPNGEWASIFDPARLGTDSVIDIPSGESEELDVATRCDDEQDAFGFNNESYRHRWRNPRWLLPRGRYLVEVTIRSEGQKVVSTFLINNDLSRDQFRLEGEQSVALARQTPR